MVNRGQQLKIRKLKKSRRKAYLKGPKHAGPAVGWLDWVHGRAGQLTKFESWFFGFNPETGEIDGRPVRLPQLADMDAPKITRASSNARRRELVAEEADGNVFLPEDFVPYDGSLSSKELVEKRIRQLRASMSIQMLNCVSLPSDDPRYRWCLAKVKDTEWYIIKRAGNLVFRSYPFADKMDAIKRYKRKLVMWETEVDLDKVVLPNAPKPYLTGGGNIPFTPPYRK